MAIKEPEAALVGDKGPHAGAIGLVGNVVIGSGSRARLQPGCLGSSRFAAPRRIFLGSTAARILVGTDAPVVVVPRDDA